MVSLKLVSDIMIPSLTLYQMSHWDHGSIKSGILTYSCLEIHNQVLWPTVYSQMKCLILCCLSSGSAPFINTKQSSRADSNDSTYVHLRIVCAPKIAFISLPINLTSYRDGYFEYPLQHMFWLRKKKNNFPVHTLIWKNDLRVK